MNSILHIWVIDNQMYLVYIGLGQQFLYTILGLAAHNDIYLVHLQLTTILYFGTLIERLARKAQESKSL